MSSGVMSKERGGFPCNSIFPEISRPGRSVLVNRKEGERHIITGKCVVLGFQYEVCRAAPCPGRCS